MIDHDSPMPLHEQLANTLRDRVTSGNITGRVPSIMTIAQEYEVGHNTAARALYARSGFTSHHGYHYRIAPGPG